MSLILEALKKSEQQRRLGEAPTLASPVVPTRRRRSLLPLFAILIVIAAGAGWWLMRPSAPTPVPATTDTPPAPAPVQRVARGTAAMGAQDARSKTPARPAPLSAEADEKRRDARAAQTAPARPAPPAAAPQPATRGPTVVQATTSTSIRTKDAAPAATPAAPSIPQDAGAALGRQSAITGRPVDARVNPSVTAPADQAAAPATGATAPPATFPAATPRTATDPTLVSIWELPYSTRKDLPAIDLTMHVYSSNPAQRFVVIKGDRHVEGDEIGQDLVLREIRQDGLVLEYKGQRFLFPRSGR